MALLQRIKTAYAENPPEHEAPLPSGPRSAGEVLRQRREELGFSLEEVARALKIKPNYVQALEEGKPGDLPGPTYVVGFTRSYSDLLGLDSAEVLRRLKAEKTELQRKPDLSFPIPLAERSLPSGSILVVALTLALIGYGGWYYLSNRAHFRAESIGAVPASLLPKPKPEAAKPKPEAAKRLSASAPAGTGSQAARQPASATSAAPAPRPVPVSASQVTPAAAPSASPAPPSAAAAPASKPQAVAPSASPATPASPSAANAPAATPNAAAAVKTPAASPGHAYGAKTSRIVIRASAASWVEVRAADHSILFERVLKPGDSYRVPNEPGMTLETGNAGGLSIAVDGKPAPPLGGIGGVLRHVALDPRALLAGKASGG